MPIYEYKCRQCGREFEELVFGDDNPPCPGCGNAHAERLLSCACLHMPTPSRAGQTVTYPSSGTGGGCAGCTASSCAGCK
ncbi:zinc ribbon domain-containing protein [Desulfovibrio sp. OttesenSCG-928-G11]|nr:zinc ribbon domain-containing protein [Desulfovibrio sp. OttesenSCG-928-G11]